MNLEGAALVLVPLAIAVVAALYASVGHGGASGYLAVLSLLAFPAAVMKPTALVLNLFVAAISGIAYARAGHFRWRLLCPFAVTSVPAAFLGGAIQVPEKVYGAALAFALVVAASRLAWRSGAAIDETEPRIPSLAVTLPIGAALGFLAGLVGVGGGIFLSPLLLLLGWATPKKTAAVSAAFIWVNSAAGLVGHLTRSPLPVEDLPILLLPALAGGFVGGRLGARRLTGLALRRLLALVLLLAAGKIVLRLLG